MKLPELSVRRPVTTWMVFVAILIFGGVSLSRLNLDLLPDITLPAISVITYYPGAGASDVESNVTKYIENDLIIVSNLKELRSVSSDNLSIVTAEFDWGSDLEAAANDVRDKLEFSKYSLPKDVERPIVFKMSSSMFPILYYLIVAKESAPQMYYLAEKKISDRLKRLPGVGAIIIEGGQARQIRVDFDSQKLTAYGLGVHQIRQILPMENVDFPVGSIKMGRKEYQIRVPARFKNLEEIRNTIVGQNQGKPIFLKDVAEVRDGYQEPQDIAWGNGGPAIGMMIQKQPGANTVEVTNRIKKTLKEEIIPTLPSDIKMTAVMDGAKDVQTNIRNLKETLYIGLVLVVLVTFVFLRRFRSSIIILLSLPFSLIIAFLFLYLFGYTINIMTLSSLVIAVGMLVDDAIVILENIVRHIDKGENPREAAIFGASEVGLAVTASTLTTVVVFVPLIFITGLSGVIFRQLAIVVCVTVGASLFNSLTLTPMLTSRWLKSAEEDRRLRAKNPFLERIYNIGEQSFLKLEERYSRLIGWALDNRKTVVIGAIVIFVISILMTPLIGTELMPKVDLGQVEIQLELDEGVHLEESERISKQLMAIIQKEVPEVVTYSTRTGQSQRGFAGAIGYKEGNNVVYINATLVPKTQRKRSSVKIAHDLREKIAMVPGLNKITVNAVDPMTTVMSGQGAKPIVVEVYGDDLGELRKYAGKVQETIAKVPGASDVTLSSSGDREEIWVKIDRWKASALGVSTALIADTLRTNFYGSEVTKFRDAGDDFDIFFSQSANKKVSIADVENVNIQSLSGKFIPLKNLASITTGYGPTEIQRKDRQRLIKVEASLYQRSLGEVVRDIKKELDKIPPVRGLNYKFGGEAKRQAETFRDLILLLILGITLVIMVMASQFESLVDPFIIISSVPFAFVGVIWILFLTGTPLSMMAFIGGILLVGIVVKNAIVMIDYVNILRSRGYSIREALITGGSHRLRPVLMTTGAMIFGVIPMALSRAEGAESWNPLGVTIIGGLAVSTLVTLVLVPVIYYLVESRIKRTHS